MNYKNFYESIRLSLFKGKISQSQFEGIEALLNECNTQDVTDKRQIAYILATAFHEVAGTMQPIAEFGKGKNRTYGHKVWHSGKTYNDVDHIYYGRGHTQNTWRENYVMLTKAAKKQGRDWDFENNPDLLLQIEPSAWATVYAMKAGSYTGVSLSKYFKDNQTEWVKARKIINGLDKAELIAGYAKKFYDALLAK